MKRKVLFILNGLGKGGIVSSFCSLYDSIKGNYDIKVLVLSTNNADDYPFCDDVISDFLLTSYNNPHNSLTLLQKLGRIILMPYKRLNLINGKRLPKAIIKNVSHRLQNKYKFDIVVGYSEGLPTLFASTFQNIKTISWIHCDYKRYYDSVCKENNEIEIYRNIDIINCVSDYTRKSFISIYPSLAPRTQFIYNFFDTERIKSLSKGTIDDNRFDNTLFTLISVGRVDPVKRFSEIPQIAQILKNKGLKFRWYILGPKTRHQEDMLLNERILQYAVEKEVVWLGNKTNPYPYMAASNLYVCLSSSEACPMVFNEAKLLNLPILTTDFGSAYEFLSDGENGCITSLEEIPGRLSTIISNPSLLERYIIYIRKEKIDNTQFLKKIEKIFQ